MERAVYIVFSATPTGMGRLIRVATRNRYNHVSLSLDANLNSLWSFARYHKNAPLYGGLVRESLLRYAAAQVKVCRLDVEPERYAALSRALGELWTERERYIYNTPAAVASLVGKRPAIPKAHTCATFVQEALIRLGAAKVGEERCPTIRKLETRLEPYVIYEGPAQPLAKRSRWGEDVFPEELSTRRAVYTTARHFGRLAKRLLRGHA